MMKITKVQLKQIIEEEIGAVTGAGGSPDRLTTWLTDKLGPELGGLVAMCVDESPRQAEIAALADELIIAEGEKR